ncbi:SGNH/GDSL hydrolase family protein [Dyella sp. LX-66]|uniref:SGNH/GDSL hydrolase family protein n=1 Tax=unclassified Dyella TaxID=2634549 RepID=UPI001BE0E7AE|nr:MULTISPECIES: SGNH/GDSL hydrolase family protein [unclassified Dyella]MBT2119386.1 SGNH/GDSL hydrolase family protein [Dyella sp. LX-1]MBT2138605.1 SGNH/GDSL hydrolase family protein [Dyella sp. LX-66]
MSKPHLRFIVFAILLGSFGPVHGQSAADHEDDEPKAYSGRQISDDGPEAPMQRNQRAVLRAAFDRDYTYVRCWYRKHASDLDPQSGYEWARTAQGSYYKLPGYWHDNQLFEWRNIFYTTVTRAELERTCQDTLRQQSRPATLFDLHAADNRLSFNYLIWTNSKGGAGTSIDRIVSFGDSLSDTMNLFNGALWKMPHRKSWLLGRFSNGPLWNEKVAAALGLPLYNWSIGGAAGDRYLVIPGLREQVASWAQYMRSAKNYQPARTLFMLWIGANDLISYGRSAESVAQHVETSLSALIAQGARHVLVLNLPDLTLAPGLRSSKDKAKVTRDVSSYNSKLSDLVDRLQKKHADVQLALLDNTPLLRAVAADLAGHGLSVFSDSCLKIEYGSSLAYTMKQNPRPACTRADDYFFWDGLHPTAKGHQILADKVTSFLLGKFPNELSAPIQSDVSDKAAKHP